MKALLFAAKLAASALLLWLSLRGLPLSNVAADVVSARPGLMATAIALLILLNVLVGVRWQRLLRAHGAPLPLSDGVAFTYVGQLFNSALPSTVGGDAARMLNAARAGAPVPYVVLGTVLDRVSPLLGVTLLSVSVILIEPFGLTLPRLWRQAILGLAGATIVGGIAFLALQSVTRARRTTWQLPARLRFLEQAIRMDLRIVAVAEGVAWSLAITTLHALAILVLSKAVGIPGLTFGHAISVVGPVVLATVLPISVAGWGVREVVLVDLLGSFGVTAGDAVAISLLLGIAVTLAALPGAPLWFLQRGKLTAGAGEMPRAQA